MTIAAGDGAILAKRVRGGDGKKIAAGEWAKSAGVNCRRQLRETRCAESQHLILKASRAIAQEGRPWP